MGKITIEFDDKLLAAAVLSAMSGVSATTATSKKAEPKEVEEDDADFDDLRSELEEVAAQYKKDNSAAELKKVLAEFDARTIKAVADEDLEAVIEALTDGAEDDDEEEDEDDITVEAVKIACQAFAKSNSKEELDEILEDYDIKSVRSLSKLSQDDLEELYAEVSEE